ncbi:hypothetical protein ACFWNH_30260 [Rhodococcus qingshengii]|uniref:hypothetical protein n=1 Tax=Rhodococcus qingshengii TaxID=334542 RepID=UPI00365D821F
MCAPRFRRGREGGDDAPGVGATRHQQALDKHHTPLDDAATAAEELARREHLTPAQRHQEQRLRTTITAKNRKPRRGRASDHTNLAIAHEYQRHRTLPMSTPHPPRDTGRDHGL